MSTTTIDDELGETQRRISWLRELPQSGLACEKARIERHLAALAREEASALTAAGDAPDEVEERLAQLRMRLAVAENSVAADASDEWTTYAIAVEDELRSWDTYLERLQATSVARAWHARERAEAAIAAVRSQRIAVYDRLARARGAVYDSWQEQRNDVSAARDELERRADELAANLSRKQQR